MRIGILGSGLMCGKLGTLFARAGHHVVFSYSRSRNRLEALASEAGAHARAGTPREAAEDANDTALVVSHTSSGAEELAKKVAGASVVSAFGTVPSEVLFAVYEKRRRKRRPSLVSARHGHDGAAPATGAAPFVARRGAYLRSATKMSKLPPRFDPK